MRLIINSLYYSGQEEGDFSAIWRGAMSRKQKSPSVGLFITNRHSNLAGNPVPAGPILIAAQKG
jgi:hypothetical protein